MHAFANPPYSLYFCLSLPRLTASCLAGMVYVVTNLKFNLDLFVNLVVVLVAGLASLPACHYI